MNHLASQDGIPLRDMAEWRNNPEGYRAKQDARSADAQRPRYILEERRTRSTYKFSTPHDVAMFLWGRDLDAWNIYQLQVGLSVDAMRLQNILESREMSQCEH